VRDAVRGDLPADEADRRGLLGYPDLARYQPLRREALCRPYRGYRVCGFPPPSSGARRCSPPWASGASCRPRQWARWIHPSLRRSRAAGLRRPGGLRGRSDGGAGAGRGDARRALPGPPGRGDRRPGWPPGGRRACAAKGARRRERPSTSHLSIVDGFGNAVALTSSIEDAFGNRRMAGASSSTTSSPISRRQGPT
jgi:gamma-glutamyltranspeptidase/glutathione hydrolase